MNVSDFIQMLQDADTILSPKQTRELEAVLEEYPYFQAARALHLKGLKNLESFKYNGALKLAAAHTTDREVLFDFITSREFDQNHIANTIMGRETALNEKKTVSEEIVPNPNATTILGGSDENPLPQNIDHAERILDPALFDDKAPLAEEKNAEEESKDTLELGKPIPFTKTERHSFTEWLQLTRQKPLTRDPISDTESLEKRKKFELLDRFIESNPKIVPKEESTPKVDINESLKIDKNELMTETLARVYLEQKKYKKAIQAYKILSLKYPEKSGFFADQIRAVKNLNKEKEG